jgi:hypothetical protein
LAVELIKFVQQPYLASVEWREVEQLADRLLKELNAEETLLRIAEANRPGTSSAKVQAAFRPTAERLGFHSERMGLFSNSLAGLRPDYFLSLADAGIILEVERGKTTTNNMDLLDFLEVPHLRGRFLPVSACSAGSPAQSGDDPEKGVHYGQASSSAVLRARELHKRPRVVSLRLLSAMPDKPLR